MCFMGYPHALHTSMQGKHGRRLANHAHIAETPRLGMGAPGRRYYDDGVLCFTNRASTPPSTAVYCAHGREWAGDSNGLSSMHFFAFGGAFGGGVDKV